MASRPRRPYAPRMAVEDRREQLLDAALDIIARDGWTALTMEALAREIDVTRPVVYSAFRDLSAVLAALFNRQEHRARSVVDQALPTREDLADPDAALVRAVTRFVEAVAEDPRGWRLVLLPPDGTPSAIRHVVERNRRTYAERITELVAWGLEQRGGPAGLDVELAAHSILAMGEEAGRLLLVDPERYSPARMEQFVRTVMGALARE
ncbi:TetR/AcrR family transcriptional regulator [Paraconexibacter sp.]|uniref:TetR/AcrR family transcriptional regulator n=1 Tax=Paraconexibacter sp. TaxID=2949640 RepID=UPI00356A9F8C